MNTIYQPSGMAPYCSCHDLSKNLLMSCIVNGLEFDSYQLTIKNLENVIKFDSGSSVKVLNTDSNIIASGNWTKSTNQIIDSSNSSVQYYGTGWAAITASAGYYNNTVHNSAIAEDYIQYVFVGTGIDCYFTEGKDKGIFHVFVDGVDNGTVDTYITNGTSTNGNNFKVKAYSITNLPFGNHTIKIVVTGDKYSASTMAKIEFDYFQILNTNGSKNSNTKGNYIQYTFTSNGIEIYMDMTPDSGTMQVYVDNIDKGIIDLFSNTYNMNSLAYSNMDLKYGSHVLKIVVTGNKNTQSSNSFVYFESLEITNKTMLPTMLHDKQLFEFILPGGTIKDMGALKWQLILWNSSNNGESVSSGEMIFTSMSLPTNNMNTVDTITDKSYIFTSKYSQAENIPIKKYNYSLYSINYKTNCGYFGQSINGTQLDCGSLDSVRNRYHIDCGTF